MKKCLWLSDYAAPTGFAKVAENITNRIKDVEFDIVASNYFGDPHPFPHKIYMAQVKGKYDDWTGLQRCLKMLHEGDYDYLFIIQDLFYIKEIVPYIKEIQEDKKKNGKKVFKWIYYYPVDGWQPKEWTTECAKLADVSVTYTEYAKKELQKADATFDPQVIYHGIDTKVFKPLSKKARLDLKHNFFHGIADGKVLITNVNTNWLRKDWVHSIASFALFNQEIDSFFYMHTKNNGKFGLLTDICEQFGLEYGKDYALPTDNTGNPNGWDETIGSSPEEMNKIYNMSDMVISTTLGEGWGLSSTEAMAAGVPVVMPDNTSLSEILAYGRGQLAKNVDFVCYGNEDYNRVRPVVSTADMVKKMKFLYNNHKERDKQIELASNWVKKLDWDIIAKKWQRIFDEN